ncbi:hypothetical protein PHISCL_02100 [Aspergillus sclerotialis]|uniref:C6 transcription factor n=1 Tax=Aspergillus sclerotialis TaxID=2070753 RepID=A0A3A2ZS73_9EURO|nr:hypothetical protein PHISCL_02100 [Aspergillus sclerotialis]
MIPIEGIIGYSFQQCQETRPFPCANCVGRNMTCEYPSKEQPHSRSRRQEKEPSPTSLATTSTLESDPLSSSMALGPLSSTFPNTFTTDDMRFFHHFLVFAHPHLPFGSEESWKTLLPVHAHECPHLMHAILSLGATHLSSITPDGAKYNALASAYRGKALRGLSKALDNGDKCNKVELDMLLATSYTLIFQARYMADGLVDFAVMIRGCEILTWRILNKYRESDIFKLLSPEDTYTYVAPQIPLAPYSDPSALEVSINTLGHIRPLLRDNSHRITYQALLGSYKGMQLSIRHGFVAFTAIYDSWRVMDHEEFMAFLDPTNNVSQALLLHYIVLTMMLRPVFNQLSPPRVLRFPKETAAEHQWGCDIYKRLPSEMRLLVDWQAQFIALDKALIENSQSSAVQG